jgi:beta-lactamase regulating signal transducer with metallopeptidase domain
VVGSHNVLTGWNDETEGGKSRYPVVLPMRLLSALDKQQTAMVLAHELAHLRRRDHWVRGLELVVSVLYWWNPLVWWVRRRLHAVEGNAGIH